MTIRILPSEEVRRSADALAGILVDAVSSGASVSFMSGFAQADGVAYWLEIAAQVAAGRRIVFAAGELDGTAQLVLDTPPNQPHRAELAKLLVHRRARRGGLARALFHAVEAEALRRGRTLLTFDTVAGSAAEQLYVSCGCVKAGEIPGYALLPTGEPVATSVFYKRLR